MKTPAIVHRPLIGSSFPIGGFSKLFEIKLDTSSVSDPGLKNCQSLEIWQLIEKFLK